MTDSGQAGKPLSREQLLAALSGLDARLRGDGVVGEICLFGGAVMVLAFQARPATRDVDALFHPAQQVRTAARAVAAELGLPDDWLNDGVKGFLSDRPTLAPVAGDWPNLRVYAATAEYLLAMKCLASRLGGAPGEADDTADILFLIRRLGLKTPAEVLGLVARYYPEDRLPVRARYLVESLFEEGRA